MRAHPLVAALLPLLLTGCVVVSGEPDSDDPSPSPGSVDLVQRSLRDVERFWSTAYPPLADGDRFSPIRGGYHPYTRTDPPPACGPEAGEYQAFRSITTAQLDAR